MTTSTLQRRFLGGGLVTLAVAVGLPVLGGLTTAIDLFLVSWLAVGGVFLVVAGTQNRVPLGIATVGWPRIAAVGLAVLSLGSSSFGFMQLLTSPSGWGLLNAGLALLASLVLALATLECVLGGVQLDEELFSVD